MVDVNKTEVKDVGNISPLGYSKPIEDVRAYGATGLGQALSNVGSMLTEGVGAVDKLLTTQAKAQGEEFGHAMYNAYTQKLEGISNLPGNQQPSITNAEAPAQTVPEGLIQGGDALAKAQEGLQYTKPGTPLQTLYLAQITKGAKELNDRWGGSNGYGDVVDQQIEKATGWNPNKYVQQLIAGINQNASAASKEPNQVYNMLKPMIEGGKYEQTGADAQSRLYASDVLDKYNKGDPNWTADKVNGWANRVNAVDADQKNRKTNLEIGKAETEVMQDAYTGLANREVSLMVHKDIDKLALDMGLARNGKELESWANNALIKGADSLKDPTQALRVQQALMARANMIGSMAATEGNRPQFWRTQADKDSGDKTKMQSYIQMLGPNGAEKWNSIVKEQTSYIQKIADSLAKGQTAVADFAARQSQVIIDGGVNNALTNPDQKVRDFWTNVAVGKQLGGDNFSERFFQTSLINNYGSEWVNNLVKGATFGFVTQGPWTTGQQSNPDTVKATIDKAQLMKVESPKAFKDLVGSVNQIVGDNPDPVKARQTYASFHPDNYGLVSKFKQQGDVYAAMTTPALTKEIWRLGQSDPRLWNMYDAWFKNSFSEVAGPSLRELSKDQDISWLHIGYDTKKMEFSSKPDLRAYTAEQTKNNPHAPVLSPDPLVGQVESAVFNLNKAMGGFKTFAETSDSDVNTYLRGVLKGLGLEKGSLADKFSAAVDTGIKAEVGPPQKAPEKPQDAPTSRKTEEPKVDSTQIANYTEADRVVFSPDLSSWLANPGGQPMSPEDFKAKFLARKPDVIVGPGPVKDKNQDRVTK